MGTPHHYAKIPELTIAALQLESQWYWSDAANKAAYFTGNARTD